MDKPKSINIGGLEYGIVIGEKDDYLAAKDRAGEVDHVNQKILVRGGMGSDFTDQVIAHEIIHALFFIAQIDGLDQDLNEKVCLGLENPMFRMLRDNDLSWFRPQKAQK